MFELRFTAPAFKAIGKLPDDDHARCIADLSLLSTNPFPGVGGDKEKLSGEPERYRLHISRKYTAMYRIYRKEKVVVVTAFGTIGYIHKKYNL